MRSLGAFLLLMACAQTTSAEPGDIAGKWVRTDPSGASITLEINDDLTGLSGAAPCNRYFGVVSGPLPEFRTGPIGASRRACPALDAEQRYFMALASVTMAARDGETLTLSNASGPVLVFTRAD